MLGIDDGESLKRKVEAIDRVNLCQQLCDISSSPGWRPDQPNSLRPNLPHPFPILPPFVVTT